MQARLVTDMPATERVLDWNGGFAVFIL